jgi:glucosamine--fructose-6-phosphate aminotransferase (isomerizing)
MRQDIDAVPDACAALRTAAPDTLDRLAAALRAGAPRFAIVCGRGSSGHAGTYLRYLLGLRGGLIAAEASPSILTVHRATPAMADALFILLSQSGRSPDLVASAQAARAAGAETVAIVNDAASPAAQACAHVVPILAGPERAVAATKTVVNTVVAGAGLVAAIAGDAALDAALDRLPAQLARALELDWSVWGDRLRAGAPTTILARGPALAVAQELALKLAECAGVPALAYSTAEFRHGPRAALAAGATALVLRSDDASAPDTDALVVDLRAQGARVFVAGASPAERDALPVVGVEDPHLDPVVMLIPAYGAIEAASRRLGRDPDAPPGLSKVTRTL